MIFARTNCWSMYAHKNVEDWIFLFHSLPLFVLPLASVQLAVSFFFSINPSRTSTRYHIKRAQFCICYCTATITSTATYRKTVTSKWNVDVNADKKKCTEMRWRVNAENQQKATDRWKWLNMCAHKWCARIGVLCYFPSSSVGKLVIWCKHDSFKLWVIYRPRSILFTLIYIWILG